MARTIAQRDLRNDNARVIEAVVQGETFLVTRNGVLVAELRPVRPARPSFVAKTELTALATPGPDRKAMTAALDDVVDQRVS